MGGQAAQLRVDVRHVPRQRVLDLRCGLGWEGQGGAHKRVLVPHTSAPRMCSYVQSCLCASVKRGGREPRNTLASRPHPLGSPRPAAHLVDVPEGRDAHVPTDGRLRAPIRRTPSNTVFAVVTVLFAAAACSRATMSGGTCVHCPQHRVTHSNLAETCACRWWPACSRAAKRANLCTLCSSQTGTPSTCPDQLYTCAFICCPA